MRALLPTMIAMTLTATAVDADTALIIANTRYQEAQNLRDADDFLRLEEPLAEAGFDVIVLRNGDSAEIRAALSQLLRAEETERIVIAAAGHFLRSGRETWLMGSESDTPDLATVSATGAPLSVMAEIAANAPGRALIMLGLESRQFDTGPGLERGVAIPDVPQGVTVIAGSPDDLRRFASQEVLRPGRDLATALSEGDDLTVFGFVSPSLPFIDVAETAAPPSPAPQPVISVAEVALWDAAQELDTVSAYRAYLVRYPSGGFVDLAQDRIAVLEGNDAASQAEAIEDALGLSRDDRRAIQGDLTVLGFDTRGVDGIFGGGTRGAIRDWQQREGVEVTGFLTGAQVFRLSRQGAQRAAELEAEEEARRIEQERADIAWWQATGQGSTESGLRSYLDRYPDGVFSDRAEAELALITQERDRDAWAEAQARDRVPAYRAYLDAFPDGLFAEDARAIIAARTGDGLSPSERAQAEAREAALNLSPVARSLIEQRLASVGLDPGRIDGTFDDQTRRALRRYQEARGVVPTGYVDQGTVVRLMAEVLGGRIIE